MASMIATASDRLTIDQLDALNLEMDNGVRYELIDGELFVSTTPHHGHQFTSNRVAVALTNWSDASDAGSVYPAPGIVFAPEDAAAPDIAWISRDRLGEVLGVGDDGRLHAAPDLIVEILSRGTENTRRDREKKLDQYGRYGVREYWIVDWRLRTVDVFRHDGDRLRLIVTSTAADALTSPLLPGFSAVVGELCPPA
jgi:Uma2 family endonuclease